MSLIIMDSLNNYSNGRTIKPGNICLNIKELLKTIPSMVEMAVTIALDIPILQVCAALNLWKSIIDVFTIEISKDQAYLIVSLWKNSDSRHNIAIEEGLIAVNALLERYGEQTLNNTRYNHILESLEKIHCIELEDGVIWLREWISKRYIDSI